VRWPDSELKKNSLSISAKGVLKFGFSTWVRIRDLRINRNPGSSKTLINQVLIVKNNQRVIFRVIERKL